MKHIENEIQFSFLKKLEIFMSCSSLNSNISLSIFSPPLRFMYITESISKDKNIKKYSYVYEKEQKRHFMKHKFPSFFTPFLHIISAFYNSLSSQQNADNGNFLSLFLHLYIISKRERERVEIRDFNTIATPHLDENHHH